MYLMQALDRFLRKVEYLPPAPQILPKLLPLLSNPDSDSTRLVDAIRFDPSVTAQILKACNSAAFGSTQPTADLLEAINLLGFHEIYRRLAIVAGLGLLRVSKPAYGIMTEQLWRHSATAALAAQLVARSRGQDENVAFTSGLLHDLGKVVLAEQLKEQYATLLAEAREQNEAVVDFEKKNLGFDHANLGGRLLTDWGFAPNMIAAVAFHHRPVGAGGFDSLAASVCVGNLVSHLVELGAENHNLISRCETALKLLNLSIEDLPVLIESTKAGFEELAGFCGLR